jgi:hypothetical protein
LGFAGDLHLVKLLLGNLLAQLLPVLVCHDEVLGFMCWELQRQHGCVGTNWKCAGISVGSDILPTLGCVLCAKATTSMSRGSWRHA